MNLVLAISYTSADSLTYRLIYNYRFRYYKYGSTIQESPANAKGTRDSSACMKAHCEQMQNP